MAWVRTDKYLNSVNAVIIENGEVFIQGVLFDRIEGYDKSFELYHKGLRVLKVNKAIKSIEDIDIYNEVYIRI